MFKSDELKPKIWEFETAVDDKSVLILDYYHADKQINFAIIAGAIEQIIGVELVTVSPEGNRMRVITRNTSRVYDKLKPLFEKIYGVAPFVSWANEVDPMPRNDFEGHHA